jgi:hypothetical protein
MFEVVVVVAAGLLVGLELHGWVDYNLPSNGAGYLGRSVVELLLISSS